MLLAGTIPLVGIIVEQIQTQEIQRTHGLEPSGQVFEDFFGQSLATVLLQEV